MDQFLMIFDKEDIIKGKKVFEEVKLIYKDFQMRLNQCKDNVKVEMQGFGLYYMYPFLFKEEFCNISDSVLMELSKASILCVDYILYYDKIFDKQKYININTAIEKTYVYEKFMSIMLSYFDKDSEFWIYYNKCYDEYVRAIQYEINAYQSDERINYSYFECIAHGKLAHAKFPVFAMALISNKRENISALEKASDLFAEAFQLYDDLKDWKDDWKSKRYSWILEKVMCENGCDRDTSEEEIQKLIFSREYDLYLLNKINDLCEESIFFAGKSINFIRYIRTFQIKIMHLFYDMHNIRLIGEKNGDVIYNVYTIGKLDSISNVVKCAVEVIIKQQKIKFPELTHWMAFPKEHGYSNAEECQECRVFWLAFVINYLFSLKKYGYDELIYDEQLKEIYTLKSKSYKYGWSYAGNILELPPDMDTLSELLRLSRNIGDDDLLRELSISINKFLEKRGNCYGTYLEDNEIDNMGKHKYMVDNIFGMMPAVEVNANFADALVRVDLKKYANVVDEIYGWLCQKQNSEGFWESTYYLGNYYAGYTVARLSNNFNDSNKVMDKFLDYILKSVNINGSWGANGGNPMDTAFALLSLVEIFNYNVPKNLYNLVNKAVDYLILSRTRKGYWRGCEFMAFGEGKRNSSQQMMRYRSFTCTTVLVIYTLVLIKSQIGRD